MGVALYHHLLHIR